MGFIDFHWFSIDFPEDNDRWDIAHTSYCIDTDQKELKNDCYRGVSPLPMKFQKIFSVSMHMNTRQ